MTIANSKEYTIDAGGRTLGRVATEAAKALMGKHRPDYTPNVDSEVTVRIINASKMYTRERKRTTQMYQSYSGFPGGLKRESLGNLSVRLGYGEALKRSITRMLPRNTMRTPRLKRLIISE